MKKPRPVRETSRVLTREGVRIRLNNGESRLVTSGKHKLEGSLCSSTRMILNATAG